MDNHVLNDPEVKMINPCCKLDSSWKLDTVNSDEFDGNSLDSGKWYDYAPGWRGRRQYRTSRVFECAMKAGESLDLIQKGEYLVPCDSCIPQ